MTLRTLNYGNNGIFLIMGHAGFCPSTVPQSKRECRFLGQFPGLWQAQLAEMQQQVLQYQAHFGFRGLGV